jgi:hypothetical protein
VNSRGPVNLTPVMVAAIHGQDIEQDQARVTKQLIDGGAVLSEQADCTYFFFILSFFHHYD